MGVSETADDLAASTRQAGNSEWLRWLARGGLAAQGLVFLLVGVLAARLATGGAGSTSADQSGAMATVARQPFGDALLVLVGIGLFAFALWQLSDVIWGVPGEHPEGATKVLARGKAGCVAVAYAALGVTAVKVAIGAGSAGSTSSTERSGTAAVLSWPGGQVLVAAAGVVVLAVGAYSLDKGLRTRFTNRMKLSAVHGRARTAIIWLGRIGYVARGLTFGIVGVLVIVAAACYQPNKAAGLDAALSTLSRQPYGMVLLGVVALGLICFGLFCFVDSRFRKL